MAANPPGLVPVAGTSGIQVQSATPTLPQPPVAGPSTSMLKRMGGPSDLKAGLGKRDPEEVQKIIYEASKGSTYFKDQVRKDKEVEAKGERLKARLAEEKASANGEEAETVERIIEQLEEKRDLSKVIALIDADAFYANCHELVNPELKGTPFGVGGGILTTASYAARAYGCRSAMPFFIAKKLCPQLISLKLEPELYVKASKQMMAIYAKYGPISPASLDEAYVDLTKYCDTQSVTPSEAISRLRQEVFDTTGLTVSAGVSPNKALSKICADVNKPNGQFVIDPTREGCMAFMKDIRLRRCFGLGRVTECLLNKIGFVTVGDLWERRADLYLVRNHLGQKATFKWLLSLYLGLGSNRVVRSKRGDRKTYGVEKTFRGTDKKEELDEILRKIAKSLAKDLAHAEFAGRTITLKIKHANYETVTRAFTPGRNIWIKSYKDIHHYGLQLLHKEMKDRQAAITRGEKVKGGKNFILCARLLGLRVSNLRDEREEKKANKLDGFIQRTDKGKGKVKEELSDTSDSEMERDAWDDFSGDEDEEQSGRSQLEKLTRAALTQEDGFLLGDAEQEEEDDRPLPSARWQDPEEDWIVDGYLAEEEKEKKQKKEVKVKKEKEQRYKLGFGSVEEMILEDSEDDDNNDTKPTLSRNNSDSNSSTSSSSSPSSTKRKASSLEPLSNVKPEKKPKIKRDSDSAPPPQPRSESRECMICQRELLGSEVAFQKHVNDCIDADSKSKKKKSKNKQARLFGSTKPSKVQVVGKSKSKK
ncbi:hypothetical protein JCM5353_008291 [Sporobolomyces roseus]